MAERGELVKLAEAVRVVARAVAKANKYTPADHASLARTLAAFRRLGKG